MNLRINYNLTKYLETVCVATLPFFLAMGLFNLTYDIKFVPLGSYVKSKSLRGCQFWDILRRLVIIFRLSVNNYEIDCCICQNVLNVFFSYIPANYFNTNLYRAWKRHELSHYDFLCEFPLECRHELPFKHILLIRAVTVTLWWTVSPRENGNRFPRNFLLPSEVFKSWWPLTYKTECFQLVKSAFTLEQFSPKCSQIGALHE